jgi:phosphatidylserine decarboxylase
MFEQWFIGALLALVTILPFAWKWQLGVRRVACAVIVLTLLSGLLVLGLETVLQVNEPLAAGMVWLFTLAAAVAILAFRFYRDPERAVPARHDVVVSPADGEVIYIREARGGILPVPTKRGRDYHLEELTKTRLYSQDAVVIGISMSFLDVHVNRSPIAGRITLHRHFPGRFGSLKRLETVFQNERAVTVIEREDLQVAVVQIASRLVRQIAGFVKEGQEVVLGQRIGAISLGSQVDLVLVARSDIQIMVKAGQRVRAGESIMVVLKNAPKPVRGIAGVALHSGG